MTLTFLSRYVPLILRPNCFRVPSPNTFVRFLRCALGLAVALLGPAAVLGGAPLYRFDFGAASQVAEGYTAVDASLGFDSTRGYGFEPGVDVRAVDRGGDDRLRRDFVTADRPFHFSAVVPREGNYRVTVILGDAGGEAVTTIKAEVRRLMVEQARTRPKGYLVRSFIVNTRTPRISGGRSVRLKEREKTSEAWAWDDRITLEFNGDRPAICSLEIEPADDVATVYLLGDSTVADQAREPYASWGQMLTRFLKADVAVANHSESGESYASAWAEHRLEKLASVLRPGDTVLLQFGHNDQNASGEGKGAFLNYTDEMRRCVSLIRSKGAVPVVVTPMHRLAFDAEGRVVNTLGDYPEAVRRLAATDRVALIDLHAMSKVLYESLGPAGAAALFKAGDETHHGPLGAYQLARCVMLGLEAARLPAADFVADDALPLDPAHPAASEMFQVPASPLPGNDAATGI